MDNRVFLAHHGIKGQKWGIRRYQNPDGSYTEAGRRRINRASKTAPKAMESAKKLHERFEKKAIDKGYLDKNGRATSLGQSFMNNMAKSSYYATMPMQKATMSMTELMISKWPKDVQTEYLDVYARSLDSMKRGDAAEASVWGARANAIATKQQLKSLYGVDVDSVLKTKYGNLN